MPDLEKVIEGLNDLRSHFRAMAGISSSRQGRANHIESARTIEDAIALLKAQEPRVLELEDVNRLEQNEVVWLEDKGIEEIIPAIVVSHGHLYAQQSVCLMIVENPRLWVATFDYRERWRCWTSRPDDATREAMPWN